MNDSVIRKQPYTSQKRLLEISQFSEKCAKIEKIIANANFAHQQIRLKIFFLIVIAKYLKTTPTDDDLKHLNFKRIDRKREPIFQKIKL